MSKLPSWMRDGWKPNGPGLCNCPHCGALVSTNALARHSHVQACPGLPPLRHKEAAPVPPWEIEAPEFRRTAYTLMQHEGRPWLIATCQSLIAGRWEGYVSMVPDTPQARWAVRFKEV